MTLYTTKAALKRSEVRAFLKRYIEQAQDLARSADLIPITNLQRDAALAEIAGKTAPKATVIDGKEAAVTTPTTTTSTTSGGQTITGAQTTTTTTTSTTPTLAKPNPGDSSGVPGVSNRDVSKSQ